MFVVCITRMLQVAAKNIYVRELPWSTIFRPFSMQQLGRSTVFVAQIILQTPSLVFTGSEHYSKLNSSWRSVFTDACTVLRLSTSLIHYNMLLTCRQEVNSVHRLLVISTSASHALSLSVTAHSSLLLRDFGTVFPVTFSLSPL